MPLLSTGLRYFERVARHGSIQEAARRMNVAASAVNRQILKLEDEMGTALFERLPRGMRLTVAGQALVVDARRWLADAERLRGTIDALKGLRSGHVRIATMECLASDFLPRLITSFRDSYPAVSFEIVVGGTDQCIERMKADETDLALAFNPPALMTGHCTWSAEWPIGVIVRSGHALAGADAVSIIDCSPYEIVLPSDALTLRKRLVPVIRRMGERGPPILVSNSVASLKGFLKNSNAISFLTAVDILPEARTGSLTLVELRDRATPKDSLALMINQGSGATPAVARFAHDLATALQVFRSTIE